MVSPNSVVLTLNDENTFCCKDNFFSPNLNYTQSNAKEVNSFYDNLNETVDFMNNKNSTLQSSVSKSANKNLEKLNLQILNLKKEL